MLDKDISRINTTYRNHNLYWFTKGSSTCKVEIKINYSLHFLTAWKSIRRSIGRYIYRSIPSIATNSDYGISRDNYLSIACAKASCLGCHISTSSNGYICLDTKSIFCIRIIHYITTNISFSCTSSSSIISESISIWYLIRVRCWFEWS